MNDMVNEEIKTCPTCGRGDVWQEAVNRTQYAYGKDCEAIDYLLAEVSVLLLPGQSRRLTIEELIRTKDARITELEGENARLREMFRPVSGSWFWRNCRANRRREGTKCCATCPFREEIERSER